jgi:hypothetical protein
LLAVAGGGIALMRPGLVSGRMTPASTDVFRAVARGVLQGSLPSDAVARDLALDAHLQRLDETLFSFPAPVQIELSQLLALLASAPGRAGLAGLHHDWSEAGDAEIGEALQGMRASSVALRQQAYHALRDLTNAAYYADPQVWSLMGYPGPRDI